MPLGQEYMFLLPCCACFHFNSPATCLSPHICSFGHPAFYHPCYPGPTTLHATTPVASTILNWPLSSSSCCWQGVLGQRQRSVGRPNSIDEGRCGGEIEAHLSIVNESRMPIAQILITRLQG